MEPQQKEPAADPAADPPFQESHILMLLRVRDQLKQQLMEYRTAVRAGQENDIEHDPKEQIFNSTIQDLEDNIEEAKVSFQNKTLALQRIQLMFALRTKMNQNDDDSRLIIETMKQIATLNRAIIEHQQKIREKEQQLFDIRRKRLLLKKNEEHKLQQICTLKKKQKEEETNKVNEKMEKIHKKLKKERDITTVIQNVFQNIIIGSRINWAEDPSLKALVLQLEKDVV